MPNMFARTLAAAALLATAHIAVAQTAAPAPVTAKCEKPDQHPGRLASDMKRKQWTKEVNDWQACMKTYIEALGAKADAAVKEANAAVAESNAAIKGYNDTVKEFQSQAEAAR
jgi:hypothetical protein